MADRSELGRLFQLNGPLMRPAMPVSLATGALVCRGIRDRFYQKTEAPKRPNHTGSHSGWVLLQRLPVEKIGYWRLHPDRRHLKAHPDNALCAAVRFLRALVPGRERTGDIFNLLIRCWQQPEAGLPRQAAQPFLPVAVFSHPPAPPSLRARQISTGSWALDPHLFDRRGDAPTTATPRRAFPWVVRSLENSRFLDLRDRLVACCPENSRPPKPGREFPAAGSWA